MGRAPPIVSIDIESYGLDCELVPVKQIARFFEYKVLLCFKRQFASLHDHLAPYTSLELAGGQTSSYLVISSVRFRETL